MRNTVRREDENSKRKPPVMNYTPKIRQKKSNFWGALIMKLSYAKTVQPLIQICFAYFSKFVWIFGMMRCMILRFEKAITMTNKR